MSKKIYYFVDAENEEFHFFESREKALEFRDSLEKRDLVINGKTFEEVPRLTMYQRELRHYYGTVYVVYKKTESGNISYKIFGRWKDCRGYDKDNYDYKKIVLTPYDEYKGKDKDTKAELSEEVKEEIDKADYSEMFKEGKKEKKVKRRSPF
jgi:hypothetical protein